MSEGVLNEYIINEMITWVKLVSRGRAVGVSNGLLNLLMSGGPSFTVAGRLSRPVSW